MKIHSLITLIVFTAIPVTFTACDGNPGLIPSPPPVQNINREVIIVMPPLEVKTVPGNGRSNSTVKEVSPCL
jgi:hypothetical protein